MGKSYTLAVTLFTFRTDFAGNAAAGGIAAIQQGSPGAQAFAEAADRLCHPAPLAEDDLLHARAEKETYRDSDDIAVDRTDYGSDIDDLGIIRLENRIQGTAKSSGTDYRDLPVNKLATATVMAACSEKADRDDETDGGKARTFILAAVDLLE